MWSLIDSVITSLFKVGIFKMPNKRMPNVFRFFGIYGAIAGIYSYTEYGHWYAGIEFTKGPASDRTILKYDKCKNQDLITVDEQYYYK